MFSKASLSARQCPLVLLLLISVGCQWSGLRPGTTNENPPGGAASTAWSASAPLSLLVILGVVGSALSIVAFLGGAARWGIAGLVGSICLTALALTVQRYALQMALVGLALVLIILAGTALFMWQNRRALAEVVATAEIIKPTDAGDKRIFKERAHKIQHPSTERIVREIRRQGCPDIEKSPA